MDRETIMCADEKFILNLLNENTDQKTGICFSSMIHLTKETGWGISEIIYHLEQLGIKKAFVLLDGDFYDKKHQKFHIQLLPEYLQPNINK